MWEAARYLWRRYLESKVFRPESQYRRYWPRSLGIEKNYVYTGTRVGMVSMDLGLSVRIMCTGSSVSASSEMEGG